MTFAKMRKWTEQEALEAKAFIEAEKPGLWERLVEIEATTGEFDGLLATSETSALLWKLHPDCETFEALQLFVPLRDLMRAEIATLSQKSE